MFSRLTLERGTDSILRFDRQKRQAASSALSTNPASRESTRAVLDSEVWIGRHPGLRERLYPSRLAFLHHLDAKEAL